MVSHYLASFFDDFVKVAGDEAKVCIYVYIFHLFRLNAN